jgi:5-methylcytosine-specific restriction endonuclease McrA
MAAELARKEDPANAARHCLTDMPYRMIVFERMNQRTPLYRVGGSDIAACSAENALREAVRVHGGRCFYCKKTVKTPSLTIDHAEASAAGGKGQLQNLLIACKPCNAAKDCNPIETFNPEAGREWLSALLLQVQDRLNRL